MSTSCNGLTLSEAFYAEAVKPILERYFSGIRYSAALLGWGSEVLEYDDAVSTDHNWGPRLYLFLSKQDYEKYGSPISDAISRKLPFEFHGYATDFEMCVQKDQLSARKLDTGPVKHNVSLDTVEEFFCRYLGCSPFKAVSTAEWLTLSEHKLLAVTSGKVFSDGLGELGPAREKFKYYPKDLWLYLLSAQWSKIFEEHAFVGRCGDRGDELGSMIIAARQVKNLMKLCFLIEKKYAPYNKWFGTAFSRLNCFREISPVFRDTLLSESWREREKHLSDAYEAAAKLYNNLGITNPLSDKVVNYAGRPYMVLRGEHVVEDIFRAVRNVEIRSLKMGLGSVNQLLDSTNLASDTSLCEKLKHLYE